MAKKRKPPHATVLISCRDAKGIVAAVSELVFRNGANILDAEQHADPTEGAFFMRLSFELDGFELSRDAIRPAVLELLAPHAPQVVVRFSDRRMRAAILVSREDHCLYDLLLRQRAGELACEFPLVISNHPTLAPVAEHFGVPFKHLPITPETKPEQEAALCAELEAHEIDFVILARYMQILSPALVADFPQRIINIHHSFLPAFQGARPYHQAHRRGVKVIGATAHYVTAELDEGPIVCQDVTHVSHRDDVADLVRKGRDLEKLVLARAVRWYTEDRILVHGNRTVVFAT